MFIVIDGSNGTGKTSLIRRLKARGYSTLSSPAATPLSSMLRPACRGTDPWRDIDKVVQFMLFSAARYDEYLRLVHQKDEVIVVDRWWTSTFVYQCMLQFIPTAFLEHTIHPEEQIDLVILLDGDTEVLASRVDAEREKHPDHEKCSWTRDSDTLARVADLYRKALPRYLKDKRNIEPVIIDTVANDLDAVETIVVGEIERLINERSA